MTAALSIDMLIVWGGKGTEAVYFIMTNVFFHIKQQMKMLLERQGTVQKGLKLQKKVHKPPFGVNVIHFEINGFNAFI